MIYSKDELKCCSTVVGDSDGEVCTFFIRPADFLILRVSNFYLASAPNVHCLMLNEPTPVHRLFQ